MKIHEHLSHEKTSSSVALINKKECEAISISLFPHVKHALPVCSISFMTYLTWHLEVL